MRVSTVPQTDWSEILADAVKAPGVISKAYSTFWRFSFGNQLNAWFQCMLREIEPGPINTYKGWQQLGRQVKKGEKAITLTMPVTVKCKQMECVGPSAATASSDSDSSGPGTRTIFVDRPFWFVLAQTDGEVYHPMPAPEWDETRALGKLDIERVPFHHLDGNCQGYARQRTIAISPIAFMPHRTLFHEIAHVVLGHTEESSDLSDGEECTPRDIQEVQAECVALILSESVGLPGAEFSRGYIQHWLASQTIPEKSVHRIFKAADTILKAGRPAGTEVMEADGAPSTSFPQTS